MTRNLQSLDTTKAPELEVLSADTRFSAVLRDSISEGMSRVIGVGGTRAMLYYLDLPSLDSPEKFHERLTELFGLGTAALERVMIQQLNLTVGIGPAPVIEGNFVDQVELARLSFYETEGRKGRRQGT
jgi:hypothetical protein